MDWETEEKSGIDKNKKIKGAYPPERQKKEENSIIFSD